MQIAGLILSKKKRNANLVDLKKCYKMRLFFLSYFLCFFPLCSSTDSDKGSLSIVAVDTEENEPSKVRQLNN